MSATSGGGNGSMRISGGGGGGGGGSVSEGSEAGESSQSTMSVTDSPSTSFQANHEGNITKISLAEGSGAGAVHVDMTGSSVNLTLDERQTAEGVVNMGFDNDEGANRGDSEFKSINGSIKTDKVSEAVNLELVNMVPYSNGNGTSYGVPVNGIPVKKDTEGADMSSPYDEYFVPVNEHKKYMRGEKLYVTKDKRRPASWRKCLSWIVACAVLSVVLIVAILAGTGVILSQDSDMVKEASIGRNFAGGDTKPLVTNGSISSSLDKSAAGQWLSHANNMTHMYVPRSIELGLPIDNLEWNSAYLNSNSTEYQKLLSATENQLKMILFKKEILDSDDINLNFNMVNISQDHFKVLYRMGWNFKQGANNAVDPITVEDVRNKIIESLSRNQGFIDMYHIDVEGIDVGHVLNECQFNNGGCSHICYYNYLNQQFTCTCPTHLVLDSSLKTCVEWSGSSDQDYGSVPKQSYSGEHFESDVDGTVSQYPHDHQSHHESAIGSTFEHGSTYEYESSRGQGSVREKESTYKHGSEYEEGSDHGHGLDHGHELYHEHEPEQYEPERDHEHVAKQHESERDHEHGAKQHESARDHDYRLASEQGSTQESISTYDPEHESKNSHGLAIEQGSPHEEASGHEHGHQAIDGHGLASEHGLDHDHSSHIDSENDFQTSTVHMEGGFIPHSEDNGHTDHDSLGEQFAEPAPEPTPKPSTSVDSEDALHHIGHNQPHENSYSVISRDGNLEKDRASQTDHIKAVHTTEPTFYKEDQPHSNIGITLHTDYSHQGEHEENTHNSYNESDNDHKSAPGLMASPNYNHTFESTPESSSEFDPQSQSSKSFGLESDLSGSSPSSTPTSVVQEHSEKAHSLGFDNGQVYHTVSYMDGHEKKSEYSHGEVKPSESAQSTGYSGLNNHGTEGNNHVPLLEEVLLQDSSLNATKHHEDSKFKTQSQTFLDNVEVNAKGKPVVEEIVIGESSPKTEESTSGSTLTQESKNTNENLNQETEHKDPNQKYPLDGSPVVSPANKDGTTQAYNVVESNTEEGPVQIDYSQNKGQDEMIVHDSMKKNFDDQITHTTTIPESTSIKKMESDSMAHGITDKHEENKALVDNTSSETLKSSGESIPSKHEKTHVYETTMSSERKSTSPVNSHTDFSVDEPEPKIKTRIENQPIPKNQHESHTEIPQVGNRRVEQTVDSSEVKKGANTEEPTESPGSGNIINFSNNLKQNETMIHLQKTEEIEDNKNIQSSVPKIMNEKFDKSGDDKLKDLESDIKETTSTVTESLQETLENSRTSTYVTRHDPNHYEKSESPESVVYGTTTEKPQTTGVFIHDVKNKQAGNSEEKTAGGKLEGQENTTTKSAYDSVSKKTITPEVPTSHVETTTTTISLHAKNSNATEKQKTSKEELIKTTESYSISQSENDRHSSQVNPDKTHSDEFSNNIKDEAVDNDEFNTLLDKEYKNDYSNDGKDVFNKYPSKPTFLKGDKKKLKDFGKLDKTESEKVMEEETTKPYSSEKDLGFQKHITESSFVPNYRFSTEHIPADVKESTKHDEFSSEGIPVLPYNVYNAENPDFGLLHTVSPAFETETYAADNNDETRILKTYSTDDGFDSKEEEYKSEKDFPKQDKDHKYDKQKGGKKKDLKKKGSTKDGKNVEVDDKKYYTEITGEKGENYHSERNPENSMGFTNTGVTPNERIFTTHVQNNDETQLTALPNGQNAPERNNHSDTTSSKSQKYDSQSVQVETTHPHLKADDSAEDNESERRTSISENSKSSSKSISGSKQPHVSAEEKSTVTEYPTQTISLKTENGDNMKQYKGSSSVDSATRVHEINIDTATEPYTEGETSIYHHKGFSTTEIKNKKDYYAHSIGSSTVQTQKDDIHPNMNKDQVHSERDSTINLPTTLSESSQHETSTPNVENIGLHTNMKIEKESMGDNLGQESDKSVGENVNKTTQEAVSKKESILIDRESTNSGTRGTHGTSSTFMYKTNTPDNNRDSTVYSITNSSTGQRTFEINDQDNRDFRLTNTSFYAFGDGKLPFRRIINVTVPEGGGPFIVRNYTTITGNGTGPKLKPFFRGQGGSFYDGQEFRYNTTHTFVPPPVNFSGTFGNGTVFRIENGSLPGTVFDGSFDPQEGHYHMFTNSTGTYVYSGTQPSFKIKGNSGDFGRSSVYILGNNSRSNAYFGNSTGPLRSHRVIFKNSTVFAVKNLSNSDDSYSVAKHESATTGNETAKKSFELSPSSLTAGTVYKVGDYFGYISKCAAGQFQCLNGTSKRGSACIKLSSKCDSINDCSDGSDEAGCIENGCPGNFQCADGTCLTRHLVCNGIVECSDGSDEKHCENWKCEFDEFKCPSGRCIPVVWQCDGKADCDNHTDEQNCQRSCGNDEYLCPEGWCVPLTYRCNGIKECSNGEDEQLCDCSLDEFKCQSGGCVRKDQVCNGLDDCSDRSDEWDCMQIKPNSTLLQIRTSSGEFEPVCADNWSLALSDHVCASFGYSSSAPVEVESPSTPFSNEKFFYMLKNGTVLGDSNFLVHLMRTNKTCSSKKWVDINCQEFSCGSRSMTDGSSVEGRLVGGMNAIAGQWPSVSLLYNIRNMYSCTANILTPRWVLASYNCLKMGNKNLNQKDWKFFGGSTVFEPEDGETRKILAIIPHPQVKFNQFLFSNDLALVKLDEPLSFSNSMGAVCLPEQEIQPRQICVTAGWGMNGPEDKNIRQQLQYLPVPTMDLTDCNSTEHYSGFVTDDKICAGYNSAEKSLCYNEEGAPLMCVNDRGEWELQGMLSYHSNCGRGSHPSIFSSIKRVKDWIVQTIGNSVERKITFASRR